MTRVRIKICGVRTADAAKAAADAGADAVGLVFAPASPRCVTMSEAQDVIRALPAFVEPIALFVDVSPEQITATTLTLGIRTVQLHGSESPGFAANLSPLRVIRAAHFDADADATVRKWQRVCDNLAALLWDTPPPPEVLGQRDERATDARNAQRNPVATGGHGKAFDWHAYAQWRTAAAARSDTAMILAGGLTPENVGEAITLTRPWGVDVSSGVESSRGVKDHDRIAAFCKAVHDATAR